MKRNIVIGVDISDSSIKVLEMTKERTIAAYGSAVLKDGIIKDGFIADIEAFGEALNGILRTTRPVALKTNETSIRAVLSVPESKLYTRYVKLPATISKGEIEKYVAADARSIIPFRLDELYWDYHVTDSKGEPGAVFVGVPKKIIDNYVEAFSHAGARPFFIIPELFSLAHAAMHHSESEHADLMIVDIGAHTTTIGVLDAFGLPHLSVKVAFGGKKITADVQTTLGLSEEEAESLKKEHGLGSTEGKNAKISETVATSLKTLFTEILAARTHMEKVTGRAISRIILTGGTALLKDLASFMNKQTGLDAEIVAPLVDIENAHVLDKETPALLYANVVGLALCGAGNYQPHINLLNQYRYDDTDREKTRLKIHEIRSISDAAYVLRLWRNDVVEFITFIASRIPKKHINTKLLGTLAIFFTAIAILIFVVTTYT